MVVRHANPEKTRLRPTTTITREEVAFVSDKRFVFQLLIDVHHGQRWKQEMLSIVKMFLLDCKGLNANVRWRKEGLHYYSSFTLPFLRCIDCTENKLSRRNVNYQKQWLNDAESSNERAGLIMFLIIYQFCLLLMIEKRLTRVHRKMMSFVSV